MLKKFLLLSLTFVSCVVYADDDQPKPQDNTLDKYQEWCHNLNLTTEQAELVASLLQDARALLKSNKLKEFEKFIRENNGDVEAMQNNEYVQEVKRFAYKMQHMNSDPVLLLTMIEIGALTALDIVYLKHHAMVKAAQSNNQLSSENTEQSIDLFEKLYEQLEEVIDCRLGDENCIERIENSLANCAACNKLVDLHKKD